MSLWNTILNNLPEVAGPTQKKLSFKEKLKWTLIILILFFAMGLIPLFGLGTNALQQFEYLSMILGASFGSILSLGIGPIVTASIVLQLLNGSGIVKFDLTSADGKRSFQGTQKLLSVFFIVFESGIYVLMGGLSPEGYANAVLPGTSIYFQLQLLLIFQLILGGILILFMDEVVSKWGFGSGVSLFIAAGVSQSIFVRLLSPFTTSGALYFGSEDAPVGVLPAIFHFLPLGGTVEVLSGLAAIAATILVFVMAVYGQAMKVEIPLSFGRIRGHGIRWPLSFIYTSNIPVILVAALLANVQLWAKLMENWAISSGSSILNWFSIYIFGQIDTVNAGRGMIQWVSPPNIVGNLIRGSLSISDFWHAFIYIIIMVIGCVIFSVFWVQTSGMDARAQAKQMMSSGLQIPGFRKDQRVLERLLERYIGPLTVMGAIAVGVLAAIADVTGALAQGTGILLAVMIIYKLYEEISKQHMMDMNPMMRKFMM